MKRTSEPFPLLEDDVVEQIDILGVPLLRLHTMFVELETKWSRRHLCQTRARFPRSPPDVKLYMYVEV